MVGIVRDPVGFAHPVLVDEIRWNKIIGSNGSGVAHREGSVPQWTADRTPEIDHLDAAFEQRLGFVAQEVPYTLGARLGRVIDVHACRRLSRQALGSVVSASNPPAYCVIEDEYTIRARRLGDQSFSLRIIDPPNLVLVVEILHRAGVPQQLKPLSIERGVRRGRPGVVYWHLVRLVDRVRARYARRRIEGVVTRTFRHLTQIAQICVHVGQIKSAALKHRGMFAHVLSLLTQNSGSNRYDKG
jgi:hypothetical protein